MCFAMCLSTLPLDRWWKVLILCLLRLETDNFKCEELKSDEDKTEPW